MEVVCSMQTALQNAVISEMSVTVRHQCPSVGLALWTDPSSTAVYFAFYESRVATAGEYH